MLTSHTLKKKQTQRKILDCASVIGEKFSYEVLKTSLGGKYAFSKHLLKDAENAW